ncbi:MAG: hypothetical protein KAH48_05135 [Chlorobi bacterium]|nr:hypothetical protein [Chlorobiota bacterium]
MKIFLISLLLISLHITSSAPASGQCNCGNVGGGIIPVSGISQTGVLNKNSMRITSGVQYSFGDKTYNFSAETSNNTVESAYSIYSPLIIDYGLTYDITLSAEFGYYYIRKAESPGWGTDELSGPSRIVASLKYDLFYSEISEFEYTVGLGISIPLNEAELPAIQVNETIRSLQTSTGAYGLVFHSYLRKGFKNKLGLFLINRLELNAANKEDYTYGHSLYSAAIISKNISDNFGVSCELRNIIRTADKYQSEIKENTGNITLALAPHAYYSFDNLSLSVSYTSPIVGNYYGKQFATDKSFNMTLSYLFDF